MKVRSFPLLLSLFGISGCALFADPAVPSGTWSAEVQAPESTSGADSSSTPQETPRPTVAPRTYRFTSVVPPSSLRSGELQLSSSVESGSYVVVAVLDDERTAWELVRALENRGYEAQAQQVMSSGELYYRAIVGPFKTKALADGKVRAIEALGLVKESPAADTIE